MSPKNIFWRKNIFLQWKTTFWKQTHARGCKRKHWAPHRPWHRPVREASVSPQWVTRAETSVRTERGFCGSVPFRFEIYYLMYIYTYICTFYKISNERNPIFTVPFRSGNSVPFSNTGVNPEYWNTTMIYTGRNDGVIDATQLEQVPHRTVV
mgnify:CR=1 FL=1